MASSPWCCGPGGCPRTVSSDASAIEVAAAEAEAEVASRTRAKSVRTMREAEGASSGKRAATICRRSEALGAGTCTCCQLDGR